MLEVGRLAFWKECKEKTAVRNSSELRGKAGDQLQRLWKVFSQMLPVTNKGETKIP